MALFRVMILTEDPSLAQAVRTLLPPEHVLEPYTTLAQLESDPVQSKAITAVFLDSALLKKLQPSDPRIKPIAQIPVIFLLPNAGAMDIVNTFLSHLEIVGVLIPPFTTQENRTFIAAALAHAQEHPSSRRIQATLQQANQQLNQRLQEINVIYTIGKSVASSLELEEVLSRIMNAAVNLTRAEEGFILLREGEHLFLRVSQNMQENVTKRFNVEASDSIAWRVIESGRPVMLQRETKIATGYLVRALLYIPLHAPGRGNIGVLGVVNRAQDKGFSEGHIFALSSLADFAAIAVENARLFSDVEAERSRIRTILEHATEVILVTDHQNCLLLWSQSAGELLGIPPEAEGRPIAEVVSHPRVLEFFDETKNVPGRMHTEVYMDDERIFNAQLTAIEKMGRVVVMQDISKLKELDRLKSEFVSTVSHDLRTPLTTIQGYVELLDRAGPINDMQHDFIKKAMGSLSHITDLISDLLDIGRIEAGFELEMRPLQLNPLLTQAVAIAVDTAKLSEISVTCEACAESLWVMGNASRLRQVLNNLISNAIKYGLSGGWIKVEARLDDEHVFVSVADNGLGIPVEEQPHIFERFHRVQTPETENIRGTGLGLAIVKSVIEKHKGRIWVDSRPGKGSTFTFLLPAIEPPEA